MDIESLLNEQDAPAGTARESVSRKSSAQTSPTNHSPDRLSRDFKSTLRSDPPQSSQLSDPSRLSKPEESTVPTNAMAAHTATPHLPYYNQQQPPLYMSSIPSDATDPNLTSSPYIDATTGQDSATPFPPSRKNPQSSNQSLECQQCQKAFSRRSDLVRHERIHSGDRPHPCPIDGCSKSFIQRSALTVHMRTHTGDKPHRCDQCSKPFSDSSSLARHRRTHTGLRPYSCPRCKKDFTRRTTLKRHLEQHGNAEQQQNQGNSATENNGSSNAQLQQPSQQISGNRDERPRKRQNRNVAIAAPEQSFHAAPDFQQPPDQTLIHAVDHLPSQHNPPASPTSYPLPGRSNLPDTSRSINGPTAYAIQDQNQVYKPDPSAYPPLDDEYHSHVPHTYYQSPPKPLEHNEPSYYPSPYDWQTAPNHCKTSFGNGWEPR